MKEKDQYIAGAEAISIAQAANLLADSIKSKGERDVRYRRYFRAVERAREDNAFGEPNPNKRIQAGRFFLWAQNKYALECSDYISQVSVSAVIEVEGIGANADTGTPATPYFVPSKLGMSEQDLLERMRSEKDQSRQEIFGALFEDRENWKREANRLFSELERTRNRLRELEGCVKFQSDVKAERSAAARANGLLGGRPKKNKLLLGKA